MYMSICIIYLDSKIVYIKLAVKSVVTILKRIKMHPVLQNIKGQS